MTDVATPARSVLDTGFSGTSIPRKEDRRLLRGEAMFVDDVKRHGMGYLHFVRSPYAHAKIVSVDVSAAERLEGVLGTLTPAEVESLTEPFASMAPGTEGKFTDYCLAVGKVRYIGEPVVAVVATSREVARDAADLVHVLYEPLEPLVDARRAEAPGAPVLHEAAGTNVVWSALYDWGDVDGALGAADRVVTIDELHFDRFSSTPLECSGAVVEYDAASAQWTLHCNHQFPPVAGLAMAPALRVSTEQLRFVTRDIGGGFGNKIAIHPPLTACCLLARKLRRPVHWQEWRTDQHTANSHGSERWFQGIQVAVMDDGLILGISVRALDDIGAAPRQEPLGAAIWAQAAASLYRWQHMRVEFVVVCTNKSPVGANRGYSRMQHIWMTERVIDIVAHELGLDPVEIRKRNFIRADEMPYETPSGLVYDSGDYERSLDVALELIDYEQLKHRRGAHDGKLLGIGIGSTLDPGTNNMAQLSFLNPEMGFSGNSEAAIARMGTFGEIEVMVGTVPQGQGHETVAAQVAADILGVTPDQISVRTGFDTAWNTSTVNSGTYASQFAVTGLGAIKGATEELAHQLRRLAAALLGAASDDEIVLAEGVARRKDNPQAAIPFSSLAVVASACHDAVPPGLEDCTLTCRYVYRAQFGPVDPVAKRGRLALTYASQIHACVVEIDAETGEVELLDYAAVDDCGIRLHPRIVEGQVHGAVAHAIGAALHETFTYDDDGQLLTPNFYDYHVPTALDIPHVKVGEVVSPSPHAPLGAKGMGEGGGAGIHAVCAAIEDALRSAGLPGVVTDSHNPAARVWRLVNGSHDRAGAVRVSPAIDKSETSTI